MEVLKLNLIHRPGLQGKGIAYKLYIYFRIYKIKKVYNKDSAA